MQVSHSPHGQDDAISKLKEELGRVMEADYVDEWMCTPNKAFGGGTPLEVIRGGRKHVVWRMIRELETGEVF